MLCGSLLWTIGDAITYCRAVALGDLDGDGDLDAFLANGRSELPEPNEVWLNDGQGQFHDSGRGVGQANSQAAVMADLDRDSDLDLLVGNIFAIEVVDNNGLGYLASRQALSRPAHSGAWRWAFAIGDLDGDGDLDAYGAGCCGATRSMGGAATETLHSYNQVWLNDGTGHLVNSDQEMGTGGSYGVALGDVDSDGDLDAFVVNGRGKDLDRFNTVWLNNGRGRFSDSGQELGNPLSNADDSRAVDLGDVDSDGDLDAFVGNNGPDQVWLNDGSGTFVNSGQRLGGAQARAVTLADLDSDGDLDAFVGSNTGASAWFNDGSGHFGRGRQILRYSFRHAVALGDVDSDGDLDVVVGRPGLEPRVRLNNGAGRFFPRGRPGVWVALGITTLVTVGLWWVRRWRREAAVGKGRGA
jgi:hypothetical protein